MTLPSIIHSSLAMVALTCAANAQAIFGPWVHDTSVPLSFYVSPTGSPAGSGISPSSPWPLDFAVTNADAFLAGLWPTFHSGVTINMLPGTYTLTQPLSLPAFGLSLEAYRDTSGGSVTITGNLSNAALLDFDQVVGPITAATIGLPDGLPPSVVRGLTLTNNSSGYAIQIDPSRNASSDLVERTIEVQVNQCTMSQCARGVIIRNSMGMKSEYQNLIVDNRIGSCAVGIDVQNKWYESDLFRSNRVIGSMTAMRFDGSGAKEGMLHPRILSNTIHNSSFLVGLALNDCSARIVNNTMGFVTVASGITQPTTIRVSADASGSPGESIVIVNNILFSPAYTIAGTLSYNPPEITIAGTPYTGQLFVEANDFDNSGPLFSPAQPFSATNIGIANAQFVAAPGNLHLTAASPSIANLGIQSFVVPGPRATIMLNGHSVPANCALDQDLDPRTHMQSGGPVDVLHRGSDQFIETGVRLRTATTGPNPLTLADPFGNVAVDSAGNASVDLLLDLPVGSVFSLVLGAGFPMGPEMQHLVITPFGSLALDPNSPNGAIVLTSTQPTTQSAHPFTLNLGQVAPAFTEAEVFLQAVVVLPNGVITFSNRIRLDVEGI